MEVMEEAGKEEAELARNLGEIDGSGIPFISIIADGAWSKRSYNFNYNADSGVGCTVGHLKNYYIWEPGTNSTLPAIFTIVKN
ncbi:hypothetical protein JTB14_037643 [Gonioctena quinquepunctata]|nr:hypothetical protein JTB14_037643 [Gonioctena quinquepunctata]